MPGKKRGLLSSVESYFDMMINAASVYVAFILTSLIYPAPFGPTEPLAVIAIFAVVISTSFFYNALDCYHPITEFTPKRPSIDILKANLIVFFLIIAWVAFFGKEGQRIFESMWAIIYFTFSTAILITKNKITLAVIKALRKGQFILKRTIIIGDNTTAAKEYITEIANSPECGVMILGYVGDKIEPDVGCEKLGSFKDLEKVLDRYRPTDVVFAIDSYDKRHLIKLVNLCDDRCIKVYFLPLIYGYFKNIKQIEQVGTIPIINIHATPLNIPGNAAIKRFIDIIGSLSLIILTSPLMIMAAIGIKLTSDGPIFFRQKRVGKMGKVFTMLKFRSMPVNKDAENRWTTPYDARPTKFGSFLRRFALDELPQFFNVLSGHMSLVGPRPELPSFVNEFRETVPLYMIKHYVKPGITGLAQIKGLRGDTSLRERIKHDIYYIENWSLWLDISILLKTPFKAFNKYEQYVAKPDDKQQNILEYIGTKLGYIPPESERTEKSNQKILYVASTASHIEAFHKPYINTLIRDGHEVMTLANGDGVDFNIPFQKKMFSKENKLCRQRIKEIIDRECFDLIILNTTLAAYHVRRALNKKRRPRVVNIVHGYLFSESERGLKNKLRAFMLLFAEWTLRYKTDSILTMNDEDHRIAAKNNLARGAIIPTFGLGVPAPDFTRPKGESKAEYASEDEFVMLFVGEMSKRKNQKFLIKAMPEVLAKIPNARLWLVGSGDLSDELRALSSDLGVSSAVSFLGYRTDAQNFMRDCDVYVSASRGEGLPFNIVEALGCGAQVLASSIKGHTDIIHGAAGTLFKSGSSKDFVEKLVLIKDGKIPKDELAIYEAYRNFSDETTFEDTYEKLKEAAWL